jgi:hypothetical protein
MAVIVEQFALGWHPTRGSFYRIKPQNGAWSGWITVPSADLASLAAIFNEAPVFLHTDGSITTDAEPVGN